MVYKIVLQGGIVGCSTTPARACHAPTDPAIGSSKCRIYCRAQILDTCPPEFRDALKRDLDSACQAVATAKVDESARATAWRNWKEFATEIGRDPYLRAESKPLKQQALMGFAARVRTGIFGHKKQIGGQSVDTQLRLVAQTLVLAGYDDPRRTYGSKDLDLPFRHMLKSMKDRDPAPKPMLALPVETIEAAAAVAFDTQASARCRAAAEMITVAFFFLLRVGEYTKSGKEARAVPFRSPRRAVTSRFGDFVVGADNQKNGQRGATLHDTAVPGRFCPVKALAHRVSSIVAINPDPTTPLSFVSPGIHLTAPNIKDGIITAAKQTRLPDRGYPL
eukprot:scaffold134070_cov54-Attheya_sp.AAC.1